MNIKTSLHTAGPNQTLQFMSLARISHSSLSRPCLSKFPCLRRFSRQWNFCSPSRRYSNATKYDPTKETLGYDFLKAHKVTPSWQERHAATAQDHLPPLSPAAVQLQDSLSSGSTDPFKALKERIDNDQASLDIIRVCLIAAGAQAFGTKKSERDAVLAGTQQRLAENVLKHLWADSRIWLPLVADGSACFYLIYFAVVEGLHEYVERWIKAEITQEESQHQVAGHDDNYWRGTLLKYLVDAHLTHAKQSADRAILSILHIAKWRADVGQRHLPPARRTSNARSHFANSLQIWHAGKLLVGRLSKGWYLKTDASLYEQFQALLESRRVDAGASRFDPIRLALYHPTAPDAQPFVSWLRKFLDHKDQVAQAHSNLRLRQILQWQMRRAYVVLRYSNQPEDEKWVASQYRNIFGSSIYKDISRAGKLEHESVNYVKRSTDGSYVKARPVS